MMTNMIPSEIRLKLLQLARDMLMDDWYGKKEVVTNGWSMECTNALNSGDVPPTHPDLPPYPTEDDVIRVAGKLNSFISNPLMP